MKNFEGLEFFKPSEFPEPEKMDSELLKMLDSFRKYLGVPIVITFSTNGSHSKNSQHFKGKAVDIVVPNFGGSLFSLYLIAERYNFTGIGLYPRWKSAGVICGGLHLDSRELYQGFGARWIGVGQYDEVKDKIVNKYYPLNTKSLIETKVLTKVEE